MTETEQTTLEQKRLKNLEHQRWRRHAKKDDEEYQNKLRKQYEQRRQTPEWVESRRLYAREKAKQYKEEGRVCPNRYSIKLEKYGAEKMRVHAQHYYKHRCETDSNFRAKMNERNKEAYMARTISECGSEVLYMMVRPGRPRKYQTAAPLENNTMSTPSTTAQNSANGSDDETQ